MTEFIGEICEVKSCGTGPVYPSGAPVRITAVTFDNCAAPVSQSIWSGLAAGSAENELSMVLDKVSVFPQASLMTIS